jgi:hypothetical protein
MASRFGVNSPECAVECEECYKVCCHSAVGQWRVGTACLTAGVDRLAVLLAKITIVTGRPVDIFRSCINIAVPSSVCSIPRLDSSWKYLTPRI